MDRPGTLAASINLGISRSSTALRFSSRGSFPQDRDNDDRSTIRPSAIGGKGRTNIEVLLEKTVGKDIEISSSFI
jgi:hypothetical protein